MMILIDNTDDNTDWYDLIFAILKIGWWKTGEKYSLYIEYKNTEEGGIQGKVCIYEKVRVWSLVMGIL